MLEAMGSLHRCWNDASVDRPGGLRADDFDASTLIDGKPVTVSFTQIDFANSLAVFISHQWLRGSEYSEGWDGRPHPDDASGSKYELCIEVIKQIKASLAPEMKVYVWVDYMCIDQSNNPGVVCCKYLRAIVAMCDLLVTPVVDPQHASWELGNYTNIFEEYGAPAWKRYCGRGWCRLEMLFGSRIPLLFRSGERVAKFKAILRVAHEQNRRPHLLFGSKEKEERKNFYVLPPIENSWFEAQNPTDGALTSEDDRPNIALAVNDVLTRYPGAGLKAGFEGDRNGFGREVFASGNVYEGEYEQGMIHGHGKCSYVEGDVMKVNIRRV